jgi:polyisoprenyl-teichoic acid--peptidoglycan teichoic acid transferase
MASGDKPYRVYRGGRVKGKVPTFPKPEREARRDGRAARRPALAPPPRKRRLRLRTALPLTLFLLVVLLVIWAVASYLSVRSGVRAANGRLDAGTRAALSPQDGLLINRPTVIALFGTDHASTIEDRQSARRSDSIMLVRTDPRRNRIAYLSIPRDLRVDIPGHGGGKINGAFQIGGPALALRAVKSFTGIPINHLAVVDFGNFEGLIDAIGGVTVRVPRPIVSNRFDCPYPTPERCQQWEGWRFPKGEVEMGGRRALIYSRIRENRLDIGETDIARTDRQQQVIQAITSKVTSPLTMLKMPSLGDDMMRPLATDLSAWQFLQLGWRKFRAGDDRTLRCRLGGEPLGSDLIPSEENRNVIAMFLGASAPQPPPPGSPFGPGCIVGSSR